MRRPATSEPIAPRSPQSALYVAGRQEYNEQVGSIAVQRDSWRMASFGAIAVALVAVGGGVWDHTKNHPVPYVIEVDRLNQPLAIARADVASPLDVRVLRAQLSRWIFNARSVFVDVGAQKKNITDLYSMIDRGSAATQVMNEWMEQHSPFERAKDETVSVQVTSVLPRGSGTSWQVQWHEVHRKRDGTPLPPQDWEAILGISVNPPNDDASILINPTGLFVESVEWQKL